MHIMIQKITKHVVRHIISDFLWYIAHTELDKTDTLFYFLIII